MSNDTGSENLFTRQIAVLAVVFAGVVAVVVAEGDFTLFDSAIGIALGLTLRAYGVRRDSDRWQSLAISAAWALCGILFIGVFVNFFANKPLWQGTAFACKLGAKGSDLEGFTNLSVPSDSVFVCNQGPFFDLVSLEAFFHGIEFIQLWLILFGLFLASIVYIRRRMRSTSSSLPLWEHPLVTVLSTLAGATLVAWAGYTLSMIGAGN